MAYNSRFGQSIFDVITALNIGIDNLIEFTIASSIDSINDIIPTNTAFDSNIKTQVINVKNVDNIPNSIGLYNSRFGQSIFDVGLMLNGTLDNIVGFAVQSGIEINNAINTGTKFSYSTGQAITDWALKNNYIFCSSLLQGKQYIVISTEDGFVITTEDGYPLLIT